MEAARRGDTSIASCILPATSSELLMLPTFSETMHYPWRLLIDTVTLDHQTTAEADGLCFKHLVVGALLWPATQLAG
jgi:hypothetical protein